MFIAIKNFIHMIRGFQIDVFMFKCPQFREFVLPTGTKEETRLKVSVTKYCPFGQHSNFDSLLCTNFILSNKRLTKPVGT